MPGATASEGNQTRNHPNQTAHASPASHGISGVSEILFISYRGAGNDTYREISDRHDNPTYCPYVPVRNLEELEPEGISKFCFLPHIKVVLGFCKQNTNSQTISMVKRM